MRFRYFLVVVVCLIFSVSILSAQDQLTISGGTSNLLGSGTEYWSPGWQIRGIYWHQFTSRLMIGISLNYHVWSLNKSKFDEILAPYQGHGYDLGISGQGSNIEAYPTFQYFLGDMNGKEKIIPYVQVAAGVSFIDLKAKITLDYLTYHYEENIFDESITRFGLNFGLGLQFKMSEKTSFDILGRYHMYFNPGGGSTKYLTFGFGFNFSFGKAKEQPEFKPFEN